MIIYSSSAWQPPSYATGQRKGGGPSTFMRYFGTYLRDHGHMTTNDPEVDYNLHFVCLMGKNSLLKSLSKGVPIITRLDNITGAPHISNLWQAYVMPPIALHKMTHKTIYISKYCQSAWAFASAGTMNGPFAIIHNGADITKFHPKPHNSHAMSKPHTVLLHEHFRRDDGGLRTALKAFALVKDELQETHLLLAGQLSGPMPSVVENFLSKVPSNIMDSIEVIGRTNHSMLPDLIRSADIFVHPVANSACSHTVPEALACGVPVICYSGTGPAEFVGESGIVLQSEYEGVHHGFKRFPREDPRQLADAIIEILKDKKSYSRKARARAHLFSSDITSRQYLEVFETAVANPPERMPRVEAYRLVFRLNMARALAKMVSVYEGLTDRL